MNWLLAFPKTGSTLMRLFIEQITDTPVYDAKNNNSSVSALVGLDKPKGNCLFRKARFVCSMSNVEKTIILLRNKRECTISLLCAINNINIKKHNDIINCINKYSGQLQKLEKQYDENEKYDGTIVLYEEMVSNTIAFLRNLYAYFQQIAVPYRELSKLEIKYLKSICLKYKTERSGLNCNTKGNNLTYFRGVLGERI